MFKVDFQKLVVNKRAALIMTLSLLFSLIVSVHGQGPTGNDREPVPGGAADDPDRIVPLTPEQQRELDQKHFLMDQISKLQEAGYTEDEIRKKLDLPIISSERSSDAGSCYMGLWKEPENEPQWCGPGSGKAVISNWTNPPGMAHLAEGMISLTPEGKKTTLVGDWISVVNDEIGTTWYEKKYPADVEAYKTYLRSDIHWMGHPVNNLVRTSGLPGWGQYNTTHYLAVKAYNFEPDTNQVLYGDSAPASACPDCTSAYGWHWVDVDDFYNNHVHAASNVIMY